MCSHFQRGKCTKADCRYAHVRVNPSVPVCRDFSVLGYCGRGSACPERHVFECPDYSATGKCSNSLCRLPHIDRASQLRQQNEGTVGSKAASGNPVPESNQPLDVSASDSEDEQAQFFDADVVLPDAAGAAADVLEGQNNFVRL